MEIVVLGGGQLARLLALAAYPLGIKMVCIEPNKDSSAKQVTSVVNSEFIYDEQLAAYFDRATCITYETENLPINFVTTIAAHHSLAPGIRPLEITQDRLLEKNFLKELAIPTVPYTAIDSWEDLIQKINRFKFPVILKTRTSGYDGKGQIIAHQQRELKDAWEFLSESPLLLEQLVDYDFEISIISVRSSSGEIRFYPLILNHHRSGILRYSEAPFDNQKLTAIAQSYAEKILKEFDYVGVMAIEFFSVGNQLLVNEIAPRVHNSGHWTIEGAKTSQFENHLRAILGWPLGSTEAKGFSTLINCIGHLPNNLPELLKIDDLHFHTYGKAPRPNRKLGHITLCAETPEQLAAKVREVESLLLMP